MYVRIYVRMYPPAVIAPFFLVFVLGVAVLVDVATLVPHISFIGMLSFLFAFLIATTLMV